jgi:hypothetical protein
MGHRGAGAAHVPARRAANSGARVAAGPPAWRLTGSSLIGKQVRPPARTDRGRALQPVREGACVAHGAHGAWHTGLRDDPGHLGGRCVARSLTSAATR